LKTRFSDLKKIGAPKNEIFSTEIILEVNKKFLPSENFAVRKKKFFQKKVLFFKNKFSRAQK